MKLDYVKFVGEIEIYPSTKVGKKKGPTKVKGNVTFSDKNEGGAYRRRKYK